MQQYPYQFPIEQYYNPSRFEMIKNCFSMEETPFLVIDLEKVKTRYLQLRQLMPYADIYYAVKSNPDDEVLKLLRDLGCYFDIATIYEMDQLLRLNVDPASMSFGNTIKKAEHIRYAYNQGVRLFATDSEEDLDKLSKFAPQSRVFFRIMNDGTGADWPLSRKFGAHPDLIYSLALKCVELNLIPYGLSFHVGSQQRDIGQWDDAIAQSNYLFEALSSQGVNLQMLNLGGGLPAHYLNPTLDIEIYSEEITRYLQEDFGMQFPRIIIEPGRFMTGDAGIIFTEIVMIAKKSKTNPYQWVYLDVGVFGGLIETIEESIKYPVYFEGEGNSQEIILAGPTCDSMDVLYEKYKYRMPESAQSGDRVAIFSCGAYTQSYSAACFNGFPPLKSYTFR